MNKNEIEQKAERIKERVLEIEKKSIQKSLSSTKVESELAKGKIDEAVMNQIRAELDK